MPSQEEADLLSPARQWSRQVRLEQHGERLLLNASSTFFREVARSVDFDKRAVSPLTVRDLYVSALGVEKSGYSPNSDEYTLLDGLSDDETISGDVYDTVRETLEASQSAELSKLATRELVDQVLDLIPLVASSFSPHSTDYYPLGPDASVPDYLTAGLLENIGEAITQAGTNAFDKLREATLSKARQWRWRLKRVARTNVTRIHGQLNVKALSLVRIPFKQWVSTHDHKTRFTHLEADGQRVRVDAPFDVGGYPLMHPGDGSGPASEVVNCRCLVVGAIHL